MRHHRQVQLLQNVVHAQHQLAFAALDDGVGAAALRGEDASRHREHLAVLVHGDPRRDHRPALEVAFDDEDTQAEPREYTIAARKIVSPRLRAQRLFAHQHPVLGDFPRQLAVLRRVDDVQPAGHHADRPAARLQGRPVGDGINSPGQPADDGDAIGGQLVGHLLGHLAPIGRRPARADDGDRPFISRS